MCGCVDLSVCVCMNHASGYVSCVWVLYPLHHVSCAAQHVYITTAQQTTAQHTTVHQYVYIYIYIYIYTHIPSMAMQHRHGNLHCENNNYQYQTPMQRISVWDIRLLVCVLCTCFYTCAYINTPIHQQTHTLTNTPTIPLHLPSIRKHTPTILSPHSPPYL